MMTIEELLDKARHAKHMRELSQGQKPAKNKLVEDWWPKPKIIALPKSKWGKRWEHPNSNCEHRFECFSFSKIGFHSGGYRGKQTNPRKPENVCLAYGESPKEAYDNWCKVFKSWNTKSDWI